MSLLDEQMKECVLLNKISVPDGYGGRDDKWVDSSVTFDAAIVFDTSITARRAEKEGVTSLYTVTTKKEMKLDWHEVFKRLNDGKIFRVTSDGDDVLTPLSATLNMRQVTAEEWRPTGNGQGTSNP